MDLNLKEQKQNNTPPQENKPFDFIKEPAKKFDTHKIKDTLLNMIVPLTALLLSVIIVFAYIIPSARDLSKTREEVEAMSALNDQLSTKLKKLNDLIDFKDAVNQNVNLITRVLPSEALVPELLTQVDLIARESGFEVTKLSYSFGESIDGSAGEANTVLISLGSRGTFNQLKGFLTALEDGARIVNVRSLRYTQDNVDESLLDISLVLTSPYLEVSSEAVTDEAINLDIAGEFFVSLLDKVKNMRFYDINVDQLIDVSEVTESEVVDVAPIEPEEEGLTQDEIQQLLQQQVDEPLAN